MTGVQTCALPIFLQFSQFCVNLLFTIIIIVKKLLSLTSLLQISLQTTTTTDRFEVSSFLDQISALSLSDLTFLFLHFSLQFLSLFGHVLLIVISRLTGYSLVYCFTGLHKTLLKDITFFTTLH